MPYIRLRAVFCGLLVVLFVVLGTAITSASDNNTTEIEEIEQPQSLTADIPLPVGIPLYKIEVNEDGIYKVTYDDHQAAGLNVATVDPLSDYTVTAILTAQTENVPTAITLKSAKIAPAFSCFWLLLLLLITTRLTLAKKP